MKHRNKNTEETQIKMEEQKPAHPIDEGWAWVILGSIWIMSFILLGIVKSYGLFFIEFLNTFESSVSATSLLTTVQTIAYCVTAVPVLSFYVKHYNTRILAIFGSFCAVLGYGLTSIANNLNFLFFSQSVLIGISNACVFGPNLITLGKYFNKRRGLAFGLSFGANSLGGFAFPFLFRYLLDKYGLRGALLLTSGLALNTVVFASLLRPVNFYKKRKHNLSSKEIDDVNQLEMLLQRNDELQKDDTKIALSSQPNLISSNNTITKENFRVRSSSYSPDGVGNTATFNGSLNKKSGSGFVQYLSNGDMVSLPFQNLNVLNENSDEKELEIQSGPSGRIHKFFIDHEIFDCNIFRNKNFLCFMLAYCLGSIPLSLSQIFIPSYAKDIGLTDQQVVTVVSVISLTDFCGRILVGYLSDLNWIKKQHFIIVSQLMIGILMQISSFYKSFWIFIVFAIIYGIVVSTLATLFSPMLIDLVGFKNLGNAMVVLIILQGGCVSGMAPFLGYLRDLTGSYIVTLRCIGACSFGCMTILLVNEIIIRMQLSRSEKNTKKMRCNNE